MSERFTEEAVTLVASDGWRISGLFRNPAPSRPRPGVLLVAGSKHERDAYGPVLLEALDGLGIASLRVDVRGRGQSVDPVPYQRMAPLQRRSVTLDVAAALAWLAASEQVVDRIVVVAEQDAAAPAIEAAVAAGVDGLVLLSARVRPSVVESLARRPLPVFGLVSTEDRAGLRSTVDCYLASAEALSALAVFDGLGFGTTMMSARQYEHPEEPSLESMIASWLAAALT